jgi:hypothetical protein
MIYRLGAEDAEGKVWKEKLCTTSVESFRGSRKFSGAPA